MIDKRLRFSLFILCLGLAMLGPGVRAADEKSDTSDSLPHWMENEDSQQIDKKEEWRRNLPPQSPRHKAKHRQKHRPRPPKPLKSIIKPFSLAPYGGINFLSFALAPGGSSKNRISLTAGMRMDLMLSQYIGIFVGGDYVTRGAELISGAESKAAFAEIPFGVLMPYQVGLFGDSTISLFRIGGFLSFPLEELKVDALLVQNTQTAVGLYLEAGLYLPIGADFMMGVMLWAKGGITNSFGSSPQSLSTLEKVVEAGVGLTLRL